MYEQCCRAEERTAAKHSPVQSDRYAVGHKVDRRTCRVRKFPRYRTVRPPARLLPPLPARQQQQYVQSCRYVCVFFCECAARVCVVVSWRRRSTRRPTQRGQPFFIRCWFVPTLFCFVLFFNRAGTPVPICMDLHSVVSSLIPASSYPSWCERG
jgi:hypothetical protein